ncbi:hypothetical protein K493DRAFT_407790 [Basidiobolus meristosporus CBS 931.73]|uniref:Tail specific protease domain-containing protein n=1 Tax=Basidiobolus meristosporus CBS 931.73 TaxID=1314790 RepID=A0A1Y1YAI9_9FUNG|nr:hypothetical protein K493DRAFT_407790 [Basidiobolus meristosporus CBS 931.73]|eukprot:ORX94945.1 hypothetical protein K493DRAFT_407790 [Basidiobolus meristosporus CBS 931.73]
MNTSKLKLTLLASLICSLIHVNPTLQARQLDPSCYKNIPFVNSVREQTVANLAKALQFYVFKDVAKEGAQGVDLKKELEDIAMAEFLNDFQFQQRVQKIFTPLNDGHVWYQPKCYRSMNFIQAFPLTSYVDSAGDQRVYILDQPVFRQGLYNKVREVTGVNVQNFLGMEVTEIDGVPVLEALQRFADEELGKTKDPQQRFEMLLANHALTSYGQWRSFFGYWASPGIVPDKSNVTYTLQSPRHGSLKVTIPWIAIPQISLKSFWSTFGYKRLYCDPDPTSPYGMEFLNPSTLGLLPEPGPGQSDTESLSTTYINTNPLKFYQLDGNTGVLVLPTFSLGDQFTYDSFDSAMDQGLEKFRRLGIRKLILDFTNNPGGSICLGYKLLNHLFPQIPRQQLYYHSDLVRSPLSMELAKRNSLWQCSNYYNPDENSLHKGLSCMFPGTTYIRGGEQANFTQKLQYNCDFQVNRRINRKPWFQTKDVAIVTNGRCASTCSSVSNFLQRVMKVRTFVTSPFPKGTNPPISTAPGGMVFSYDNLLWQITEAGLSSREDAPKNFPQKADFYFTVMENYGWNTSLPDEYAQRPATDRIVLDESNFFSPVEVWTEISQKLNYSK